MFSALLITSLPTLLAHILFTKFHIKPKSTYLQLALAWMGGTFFFTVATFLVACCFATITTGVLVKAMYSMLLLTQLILLFFVKDVHKLLVTIKHLAKHPTNRQMQTFFICVGCFLFSFVFFSHHLAIENNMLMTTQIYWDFPWQLSLIQNFIYGDNFPPQNEAFAGLPHTYHYFWMVYAAMFGAGGLSLAGAINAGTIIGFFIILVALIGLGEEIFHSRLTGVFAALLAITSSSLSFIKFFQNNLDKSGSDILSAMLFNTEHPWYFSVYEAGTVTYNGMMYNLFYILEERQMITGIVFLLLAFWIFFERQRFSYKTLFIIGTVMGGFFLWHLQVTFMLFMALVFLLIFGNERKKTAMIFSGFFLVFLAHTLYFTQLTHSVWFIDQVGKYPAFNTGFSDQENMPFSFMHALKWYWYSYGLKLFILSVGFFLAWKKNKQLAILFAAILIPTFLLVNTVEINPPSVFENHKFFRPMNFLVDLLVAWGVYTFFFKKHTLIIRSLGIICLGVLTLSGLLENMTFINAQPTTSVTAYTSPFITAVREHTKPTSVFVSSKNIELYQAGRKLFLANNLRGHDDRVLDKKRRYAIIQSIYNADKVSTFCSITKSYKIDFVEFGKDTISPLKENASSFVHFETAFGKDERVIFVDVNKTCL